MAFLFLIILPPIFHEMPPMRDIIVIADTSCLIILSEIDELNLLRRLYGKILVTDEIAAEFKEPLPDWIILTKVNNKQKQYVLELQVDKGESSAIALAMELKDSLLILDDYKARKIAEQLGLSYTGTLGIIIKAKLTGLTPSVKALLEKIKTTNFRISGTLEEEALYIAGEN